MAVGPLLCLVFVLLAGAVVVLAFSVLLVIKFGHPDDKNVALFPKFIVILSLFTAFAFVLMLPLDVLSTDEAVRSVIHVIWQGMFCTALILMLALIPFALVFYEEPKKGFSSHFVVCFTYALVFLLAIAAIIGIMYVFLGHRTDDLEQVQPRISPLVFSIGVLCILGWGLFILFLPVGLITFPMDLINEFRTRPPPMTRREYDLARVNIGKRATALLTTAKASKERMEDEAHQTKTRKLARAHRALMASLQCDTYALMKQKTIIDESFILRGGNPLVRWAKLIIGVLGLILTLSWILHICIHMVVKESPWLNSFFSAVAHNDFPFFGIILFALHALYLLLAAVKGAFRFSLGLKCVTIYPMEFGATMMSSFLVNVWLILAETFTLMQFLLSALDVYTHDTEFSRAFMLEIDHLAFFDNAFFNSNIHFAVMIGIALLTLLFTVILPRNTTDIIDKKLRAIAQRE